MTNIEIAITFLSNAILVAAMLRQRIRHRRYREAVHALLQDEGHVEGEAEMIVDELLRMSAHLKMQEPTLQQFGHALAKQKSFRRAVAHAELYDLYIETNGRTP